MELLTLDPNFQPLNLVEDYSSLIWTERYDKNGDFELTSNDINKLVNLLPRETYVTLRDTNVPMVVETHKIVKPLRDIPYVSITGRTFETVLERRASVNQMPTGTAARVPWLIAAAKGSDAAYLAMRIVLGDIARSQGGSVVLPITPPAVSALDAIPEIDLRMPTDYFDMIGVGDWNSATAYVTGNRTKYVGYVWKALRNNTNVTPSITHPLDWEQQSAWQTFEIKPQLLYPTVLELLSQNRHGIKSVRPGTSGNQVGIEIYNGANLTGEGENGDPTNVVVIDARFDQMDNATYLLSQQGSTNVAYVYGATSSTTSSSIVQKNTGPEPSGLDRRVLPLDYTGDADSSSADVRKARGLIELYKFNATALFDGEVAQQIAAGYNRDYFLGDILKLVGEYGLKQNVRVSEFIRTADASGEKAYPTFEAVDE